MGAGDVDVFLGEPADAVTLLRGDGADDLCGEAEDEAAGGDDGMLCDEGAGADDAALTDDGTVEDDGAHSDEAFVVDGAGVDHGLVADGDAGADEAGEIVGEVEHGAVLDIGGIADLDTVDVAPEDGPVPDAGVLADGDIATDVRGWGDEGGRVDAGRDTEVSFDPFLKSHARVVPLARAAIKRNLSDFVRQIPLAKPPSI